MSDKLLSRFLRYVQIDTQSDETSKTFPSTSGQLVLLEMLKQELSELGAADVQMTRHGYVMASIPANTRKARVPTVAFLAHVDTAPDCSGKNVKPIVHRKYDGRVIKFPDKPGLTLDPATSPELRTAMGKDIVTASGTTLLGSDDKSGVAVIMTLVERLLRETRVSTAKQQGSNSETVTKHQRSNRFAMLSQHWCETIRSRWLLLKRETPPARLPVGL